MTIVMDGIDVSKYQGAVDWSKVAASGVKFAFVRMGWINADGSISVDACFEKNMEGTKAAGVHAGVYLYSYATSTAAMTKAATACIGALTGYTCDMPVALDFEHGDLYKGFTKAQNVAMCKAFLDKVEALKYYGILYTYKSFAAAYLDMSALGAYDFWLAQYASKATYAGDYGIWQYSSTGKVPGISGNVDCNHAYKDYPAIIAKAGLNNLIPPAEDKTDKPTEPATPTETAKPTEPAKEPTSIYFPKYTGLSGSIIAALTAIGETDTSYARRKKIAEANRLVNYAGTSAQNMAMVNLLKSGDLVRDGVTIDTKGRVFAGQNNVRYDYACFGMTRGNGKTWHGGLDVEGLDSTVVRMPGYNGKAISGTVTRARIVTDHSNPTWEWGYYVCVQLDANQTPDTVNYLYFCHNSALLVKVGDKVKTGDALAIIGNTGNAALANPPYAHVHFEARATATGKGVDPTAYTGTDNKPGTYGKGEE